MIAFTLVHANGNRVEVWREPCVPNWEMWRWDELFPHRLFAGVDYYARLVYELEVAPNILKLDPGPLDARVP